jgi:hypothetical protein
MGYRRSTHVAWRRVGGQTVVINLRTSSVLGLNESGGSLWEGLGEPGAPPLEPGDRATEEFLEQLRDEGIVESVTSVGGEGRACPVPPAVEWRDQLQVFAAACPPAPGIPACDQQPAS